MRRASLTEGLVPEGFLSLKAAYERYARALFNDCDPAASMAAKLAEESRSSEIHQLCMASLCAIRNELLADFRTAFSNAELVAFVRQPGSSDNYQIPDWAWNDPPFPERPFVIQILGEAATGFWRDLAGATPFVRASEFESWMGAKLSDTAPPEDYQSAPMNAVREALILFAKYGLLSPPSVENRACDWRLSSFASQPSINRTNPDVISHWSLGMSVVWIAWRSMERVRDAMDQFREESLAWSKIKFSLTNPEVQVNGYELAVRPYTGAAKLGLEEVGESWPSADGQVMTVRRAREQLWLRLGNGDLVARGRDATGVYNDINAGDWPRLELCEAADCKDYLVSLDRRHLSAYDNIQFRRSDIISVWKEPASINNAPANAPAKRVVFAVEGETIRFSNGPTLKGSDFALFKILLDQREFDRREPAKREYSFVPTGRIEMLLGLDQDSLRQRIYRLRNLIKRSFLELGSVVLKTGDVIDSAAFSGYRLNPGLMRVDAREL